MKKQTSVKVRMAPSPTGPFHIGTARTALFNWLFARQNQGVFILRIDDTDQARSRKKWEKDIKNGLIWLGLNWDEEYRQSDREKIYKKHIERLIGEGRAYQKEGVIFFKLSEAKKSEPISFSDIIRGKIEFNLSLWSDFIIAKGKSQPLYNLASVIDDSEMGITHIIRGEDHISNTPKQILLQEAIGFKRPFYAHLPMILGSDRSKLSKRHGATALTDYKKDFLPEALVNYMAFLGWNPGSEQELFSLKELTNEFHLEKAQKSGAIFNQEKLLWLNAHYIKNASLERLAEITDLASEVVAMERGRAKKISEFKERTQFIFKLPEYNKALLLWGKMSMAEARGYLKKAIKKEELKGKELWPPRVALSGLKASPSYLEIKAALGEKETLKRLKKALKKIE